MENESIQSIIAELRGNADRIERDVADKMRDGRMVSDQYARELVADIRARADRIEAAWKRERERQPLTIAEWIDKTETVADIAAVLRRYVLPSLAERLEAAWKREKAEVEADALNVGAVVATTEKSLAVGNAAALREALCDIVMLTMKVGYSIHGDVACGIIASKAKHALSAPARNCDLYATATEALKAQDVAFNEDNFKNGECRLGCPGCDDGLIDCKILWLFAPAAERKGEGDGSK